MRIRSLLALMVTAGCAAGQGLAEIRGTGDLGIVIERADGRVGVVDTTHRTSLGLIEGLGDLSHASAVFSRDARYAFVFGRDGGLTKVDLLTRRVVRRVVQAGNSIGGAISTDGSLVAVSNYEPGGIRVFSSDDLRLVADIPAPAKAVGLIEAPPKRFVFSLFETGEVWVVDLENPQLPHVTRYPQVGREPYDAFITPNGRYYVAGLFGEDGLALIDLWRPEAGVKRILSGYGKGEEKLPVYKMPHLEGWALSGQTCFVPAVGRHELLVVNMNDWREDARIPVHGQPVFAVARPDGRQVWVNFAPPHNDVVQVIDTVTRQVIRTLNPGKAVLHLEFTPRGEAVWLSVRDEDRVEIYDTDRFQKLGELPFQKPSGIFFTVRAGRLGM